LPKNIVEEIYKEYGDPDRDFKPVNLLRAEIARRSFCKAKQQANAL
jgi:hypothetical protein